MGGREFQVALVGDDELPAGRDWALVVKGNRVLMAVKRSQARPEVFSDAWVSFRQADGEHDARAACAC